MVLRISSQPEARGSTSRRHQAEGKQHPSASMTARSVRWWCARDMQRTQLPTGVKSNSMTCSCVRHAEWLCLQWTLPSCSCQLRRTNACDAPRMLPRAEAGCASLSERPHSVWETKFQRSTGPRSDVRTPHSKRTHVQEKCRSSLVAWKI